MLAALPRALSQRPYVNKAVGVVSTVYRSVVMFFTMLIVIADDEVTKNINFVRRHGSRRLKSRTQISFAWESFSGSPIRLPCSLFITVITFSHARLNLHT